MIVGSYGYSANTGQAAVHHGSSSGVSSAPTSNLLGTTTSSYFGASVSRAGDVNGDGYDDVIVGAYGYSSNAGRAYVYHGASGGVSTSVTTTLSGPASESYFGASVSDAGDLNQDGYGDVVVGAYGYSSSAGVVTTYSGANSGISSTVTDTLSGETSAAFGRSVSGAGDVDGDGWDDVLVGGSGEGGSASVFRSYGDADGDGFTTAEDCDDTDPSVTVAVTQYADGDGDGYGDATRVVDACPGLAGYVTNEKDCDDADPTIYETVTQYADGDGDGYGDAANTVDACPGEPGYVTNALDCEDRDAAISPAATEVCDGADTDEDCNGLSDDSDVDAVGKSTGYSDADGDGYAGTAVEFCDVPESYKVEPDDCDDTNASVSPGAVEVCDAADADEDCNGLAEDSDGGVTGTETFYWDEDGDGYGGGISVSSCEMPGGYSAASDDCDDTRADVSPGAPEVCDAVDLDEDCDGLADDADAEALGRTTVYGDTDGDGYAGTAVDFCDLPPGYEATASDCDDTNASVSPSAAEVCDALDTDEDCNGLSEDADPRVAGTTEFYLDGDSDGYGGTTTGQYCDVPLGYTADASDCDDTRPGVSPAATEVCDGATDEDCDNLVDDADDSVTGTTDSYADNDGDGYGGDEVTSACVAPSGNVTNSDDCDDTLRGISPDANEICDAANNDEDCDGLADNDDPSAVGTSPFYEDLDADGYGSTNVAYACEIGEGYVTISTDCDDTDSGDSPGAAETYGNEDDEDCDGAEICYVDADLDTYRSVDTVVSSDTDCADRGEATDTATVDCDDADGAIYGGGEELIGDEIDSNCDGLELCYVDVDGDGYRVDDTTIESDDADCSDPGEALGDVVTGDCDDADAAFNPAADESDCTDPTDYNCDGSTGYVDGDGDGFAACAECDDGDAAVNPTGIEVCNDYDDNCDGVVDTDATDMPDWYPDADSDGYTVSTSPISDCDAPAGYAAETVEDCDDADPSYHPDADESDCTDPNDYNCDGSVGYADADLDGFPACEDCDDEASTVNPDGVEVCNDQDDDCDGTVDVGADDASEWYADLDQDGYTDLDVLSVACDAPEDYARETADDCDDTDTGTNPGATDIPDDGIDQDCDGRDEVTEDTAVPGETGETGETAETGETDEPEDTSETGDDTAPIDSDPVDSSSDTGGVEKEGCGCATGSPGAGWAMLLVAGILAGRRRLA